MILAFNPQNDQTTYAGTSGEVFRYELLMMRNAFASRNVDYWLLRYGLKWTFTLT